VLVRLRASTLRRGLHEHALQGRGACSGPVTCPAQRSMHARARTRAHGHTHSTYTCVRAHMTHMHAQLHMPQWLQDGGTPAVPTPAQHPCTQLHSPHPSMRQLKGTQTNQQLAGCRAPQGVQRLCGHTEGSCSVLVLAQKWRAGARVWAQGV